MIKLLTEKELDRIDAGNLVRFVLGGIDLLERDIALNQLAENPQLVTEGDLGRRVHVNNIISLLHKIVSTQPFDPLIGEIIIESRDLLSFLSSLQKNINAPFGSYWIKQTAFQSADETLRKIIAHLEFWKKVVLKKIALPPGNTHVRDLYHPEFAATNTLLPSSLSHDYRSNFFFEVKVKELCIYTTCFTKHPYNQLQIAFQTQRPLEKIMFANVNVDLQNPEAIEAADNIRAIRLHGPKDDVQYPGSYIFILAGHHRTRELFQRFLQGDISGDLKLLVQRIDLSEVNKDLLHDAYAEMSSREKIRLDIWNLFVERK